MPISATAAETEPTFVPESFTREELLEMDPELDSDGDGLVDVIELVYEFNRFDADTDGDGLTNAEEAAYGTNPDDLGSDNDNLGDYDEITVYKTNPTA